MLKRAKAKIYLHKVACAAKIVKYRMVLDSLASSILIKTAKTNRSKTQPPVSVGAPVASVHSPKTTSVEQPPIEIGPQTQIVRKPKTVSVEQPPIEIGDQTPVGQNLNMETAQQSAQNVSTNIPPWGKFSLHGPDPNRVKWWRDNTWLPVYNENGTQVNDPKSGRNIGDSKFDGGEFGTYQEFIDANKKENNGYSYEGSNAFRFPARLVEKLPNNWTGMALPGTNVLSFSTDTNEYTRPTVGEHESRHVMAHDLDYMGMQPFPNISFVVKPNTASVESPVSVSAPVASVRNPDTASVESPVSVSAPVASVRNPNAVSVEQPPIVIGDQTESGGNVVDFDAAKKKLTDRQLPYQSSKTINVNGNSVGFNYYPTSTLTEAEMPTTLGEIEYYKKNPSSGYYPSYPELYSTPDRPKYFWEPEAEDDDATPEEREDRDIKDSIAIPNFVPYNYKDEALFTPATPLRYVVDQFGNNTQGDNFGIWGGPKEEDGKWEFNENIDRMSQNVGQLDEAYDEANADRGKYFATRETVQRLLDPIYAMFKPIGPSSPTEAYGDTIQCPYTVRELLDMGTSGDESKFEEAKKWSHMLRKDLKYLFDTNDFKSFAENAGSYDNVMSILNADATDVTPQMVAMQNKYSITPGFDKLTDFRDMNTMGDMIDDVNRGRYLRYGMDQMDAGSTDWAPPIF